MDESKRCALVNTIKLFGFGTLREYYELKNGAESSSGEGGSGGVWTLTDAQLEKLRMLSVVTVVRQFYQTKRQQEQEGGADVEMVDSSNDITTTSSAEEHTLSIPYELLATELQITSNSDNDNSDNNNNNVLMRQLEDVLIQCVYSNIISGKLDQATKSFIVDSHLSLGMKGGGDSVADEANSTTVHGSLLSRDIDTTTPISTSTSIKSMISQLTSFLSSSNTLLVQLENLEKISVVTRNEDEKRWRNVEKKMEKKGGGGSGVGRELENWEIGHPKQLSFTDSAAAAAAAAAAASGGGERKVKRSRGVDVREK